MRRKLLTFLLTAVCAACLCIGFSACGSASDGADGVGVSAADIVGGELIITLTDGSKINCGTASGANGVGVDTAEINADGELIITLTDGTPCNLGVVRGTNGVGISSVEINANGQLVITYTNNDSKTAEGTIYCSHSYGEWVTGKAATCTSIGYNTRTCSICGDVDYQFTDPAGHTAESYTYDNTYHYYYCTECGLYLREAHTFKNYTCTACEYEVDFGLEYTLSDDEKSYSVTGIGECTDTDIVIPSKYNGLPVTTIGMSAFKENTTLNSVIIGGNVTTVYGGAFDGCTALTGITIGENVTTLGLAAFYECTALTQIYFNATAMNDLSGTNYVFYYAGQSGAGITVTIGANVTKIPEYLFCPYVGDSTYSPNITNVVFEEGSICESIGRSAFYYCNSLESINIPDSVETIGTYAFTNCTALTSITIPDGVTAISEGIFSNCTSLTSIVIGSGVTSVGESAFYDCTNFTVYYNGTVSDWSKIEIDNTNGDDTYLTNATKYYYSETEPSDTTYNYWHYVDGEVIVWADATNGE